MCQEYSVPIKEKISEEYLKKYVELRAKPYLFLCLQRGNGKKVDILWEEISPLHGEYLMLNTSELPNVEEECFLSQILEDNPHPKYSLSNVACQGILRRARVRGKELPEQLKEVLEIQASMNVIME